MADPLPEVRPGDLITADQMNSLIRRVNAQDLRITALETTTPGQPGVPVISGPLATAVLHIGDVLQVTGRNFGLPSLVGLTLDGQRVDPSAFKPGSGDTLLIFTIPPIANVPPAGRTVQLTVSNSLGFAQTSFTLLPAAQATLPDGQLFLHLSQSPAAATITAGQSFDFVFSVQALTNLDETYTLTPVVQVDPGAAAWTATVVNDTEQPVGNDLSIPQSPPPDGTTVNVRVRVAVPAQNAGTTGHLTLAIASKRNPNTLRNTSGDVPIKLNAAPPPPQTNVILAFSRVLPPGQGDATLVSVPPSPNAATLTKIQVEFSLSVKSAGLYNVQPPQFDTNPGNLWAAQVKGASGFTLAAGANNVVVPIVLSGQAGAAATRMVVGVVLSTDATVVGTIGLNVKLIGS